MRRVVIVGAGIVGLACAWRLAREGARVTVLEADPDDLHVFRAAASGAAAGMLAPFDSESSAHSELALASFDLWRGELRPLLQESVRFEGAVIACASERDMAALQARVMSHGRRAAPLSRGQAARKLGFAIDHALSVADEGVADPLLSMDTLKLELRRLGVTLLHDQDVASVSPHEARSYSGEVFEADRVVLAPGVWANAELANAAPALRHVRPAKGHLVAVKPAKPLQTTLHAPGFYLTRRREDVVLGATLQFDRYERNVEQAEVQKLLDAVEAAAPGAIQPAGRAWAGIRPMSPDGWPMIGESHGMLVAAGHSRNGWLLAPITAEIINAYVFNMPIPPAWAALAPQRFES
ncbi:MAG TPA: FAD-dependent oxidoreductase [Terricaulis sp.]|nr:FAD-dependent oxidoreductase [Terricaulis sp.]